MHPRIVELELWTLPRSTKTPLDGKAAAVVCQRETGLPSTTVLGLNFIPAASDLQDLREALTRRELQEDEFLSFCDARGLEASLDCGRSAAEFLAFAQGQAIAWLHLPEDDSGLAMARTLVAWASKNGMQIRDGASTYAPLTESQVYALWPRRDA